MADEAIVVMTHLLRREWFGASRDEGISLTWYDPREP